MELPRLQFQAHRYDDACRLTAIVPRNTSAHPREAPVPIGRDASGNASGQDIPEVELFAVPAPEPRDDTSGPSSGSTGVPTDLKAIRGPDLQERFPEIPKSTDDVNTDWSKFSIQKSLRILRNGTENQQT